MPKIETHFDINEAVCCRYCKNKYKLIRYPTISPSFDGLRYAQCSYCNHYDKYEFLGTSPKSAIKA